MGKAKEYTWKGPGGQTRQLNDHAASVLLDGQWVKQEAKGKRKAAKSAKPVVTEESADDGSGGSSESADSDSG